jgi:hypothetical protein
VVLEEPDDMGAVREFLLLLCSRFSCVRRRCQGERGEGDE